MSVFALHNGRLVAAPKYVCSSSPLARDIFTAVQAQTLALISRPLFPVGYVTNHRVADPKQSLIALDSEKRIITIEVIEKLDSTSLGQATMRGGKFSSLSRQELAEIYPGEEHDFAYRWGLFLESTTPTAPHAPRLYIFCTQVDDEVKKSLGGMDIEVKLIVAHEGASQTLIEVVDVDNYRPHALSQPAAPWMIGVGTSNDEDSMVLDQSLWNIEGWTQRSDIAPLPYHQAQAQEHKYHDANDDADIILQSSDSEVPAEGEASEQEGNGRTDTAIMVAEMSPAPRPAGRRSRRRSRHSQEPQANLPLPETAVTDESSVLYEQLLERTKRAEQRLWDQSAPGDAEHISQSELKSATEATLAVDQAAESDRTALGEWIMSHRKRTSAEEKTAESDTNADTKEKRRRRFRRR